MAHPTSHAQFAPRSVAPRIPLRTRLALIGPLLALSLAACQGPHLPPAPNLLVGADPNPLTMTPESRRSSTVHLLYATDRTVVNDDPDHTRYGHDRSPSLTVGEVGVRIGEGGTWNNLLEQSVSGERAAPLPLAIESTRPLFSFPPTNLPPTEVDGQWIDPPDFTAQFGKSQGRLHDLVAEQLAHSDRKEVLLYVHGYNNTFDDAALRLAGIWHYLGRPGVAVAYSWPAGFGGVLRGYTRDRESGEFTVLHLRQFIAALADSPEVKRINILAHSRGTDVLITALRELHLEHRAAGRDSRQSLKLGHLILAAPDMDWEVTQQRVIGDRLGLIPERLTVYISDSDRAISMSEWLSASVSRVGRLGDGDLSPAMRQTLNLFRGASFIDVTAQSNFLGHSYFADNPAVLSDLILLLRDNLPPGAENGRPLSRRNSGVWTLDTDYPNAAPQSD